MVSITSVPESDDVTKNTMTRAMATNEVTPASGSSSSILKSASSGCPPCTASTIPVSPPRWSDSPVPPNVLNQSVSSSNGTTSMPPTRLRTVRPREIRAMNMPTQGAQESHQAQ